MASVTDKSFAKMVMALKNVPAEKMDTYMMEAEDGRTLAEVLVAEKVLDSELAAELHRSAEAVAAIPEIPNYVLLQKLGEGGMGAVFKARQVTMARDVALKILPAHLATNDLFVERFYREARSSARLDHPNVVRGYDVGQANGLHYFAMEFVDGQSVQDYLKAHGKLDPGDALKIIYDVAQALVHAGELNMVHRDIKPDNIMITKKGVIKLADLGLAKQLDDENQMTQTGSGFGTPYYMPPEQAVNAKYVDARSDIYALGATLYHLLTGKVPFAGETAMEVLIAKNDGKYPPATAVNPAIPPKVNLLIDKMMAKDPAHRYQSAAALVADLEKFGLHHEQVSWLNGAAPKPAAPAAKTAAKAPAKATAKAATVPGSKNPTQRKVAGATKAETQKKMATTDKNPDQWYLRYRDAKENLIKTKATTSQIRQMLIGNQLNDTVEASKSPDGPFRRLQAFPEFEALLRTRIAQKVADKKASKTVAKMSDLINNFDEEQASYKRRRKLADMGFILWSFVLTAVVLGGGTFVVWKYVIGPRIAATQQGGVQLQQNIQENKKNLGR